MPPLPEKKSFGPAPTTEKKTFGGAFGMVKKPEEKQEKPEEKKDDGKNRPKKSYVNVN